MSSIGNYHDFSIYKTYSNTISASSENKKLPLPSAVSRKQSDHVSVSISSSGVTAFKESKLNDETKAPQTQDINQTPTTDYKSRLATQTYQAHIKLFSKPQGTVNAEL